ncbi:hypothetical protein GF359_05530 [candidate division WOR-3 bacterium]|uniref:Actinobacteria/chloroflexi VLRF1 release factor domain-containing protein n=1 Tax=candidate division WOR-3 bacterium TaxID=2052148 RepID=A0A9D5K946_UNCW3|nr:hypothetical protein [candidate division WOR-3 bacterium]MBD3364657.1 hypothetical protein [candidate division WOR-3 bacterium]
MVNKLIVGWLDHREAKLFWLEGDDVKREKRIKSRAHGRHDHGGWSQSRFDRQRRGDLKRYYDDIIDAIGRSRESLHLVGHKQALREFRNRCEEDAEHLLGRLHEDNKDEMTDAEIVAYGRKKMR